MTIDSMIEEILKKEGGFTKDTEDSGNRRVFREVDDFEQLKKDGFVVEEIENKHGVRQFVEYGATNFGITLWTYRDFTNNDEAKIEDIKNMPVETAKSIYKQDYYIRPKIDKIHPCVRLQVFDFGVNSGPRQAIKTFQLCLGFSKKKGADGLMGDNTIKRMRSFVDERGKEKLAEMYLEKRIAFYRQITNKRPANSRFIAGWLKRANEVYEISKKQGLR